MKYSRRELLGFAAAGISVAAMPVFLQDTAYARESSSLLPETRGPAAAYDQATADGIHNRSVEQEIKEAGEDPDAVKARVDRRLQLLQAEAVL